MIGEREPPIANLGQHRPEAGLVDDRAARQPVEPHPGETAAQYADRLLAELRANAPREIPGRAKTAAKYRTRVLSS